MGVVLEDENRPLAKLWVYALRFQFSLIPLSRAITSKLE